MPEPTAQEQYMLELTNRLRANPGGEAARLTGAGAQANVLSAMSYFGVNSAALAAQMNTFAAVAPLAWNIDLSEAAQYHNGWMIAQDGQQHQFTGEPGLGQRALDFGYNYQTLGENIFAYMDDVLYGHAALVIDWGYDSEDFSDPTTLFPDWKTRGDGMQDPPGHRNNLMSSAFTEIGIAITPETNAATQVGPLVLTQDLGRSQGYQAQFVGVVIDDLDSNDFYGIGEGLGGITVTLTGVGGTAGSFATTTWAAGGWQVVVPAGTYRVAFTGTALDAPVSRIVTLGTSNVKIDVEVADEHAQHDFNGDGFSDILWRRNDGLLTDWLSTGSGHTANGALSIQVSTDWNVAGDGDFNGDGRVDLLWRNTSGRITDWLSNGTGFTPNNAFNFIVGTDYVVAATGDFNGDSLDDILWRRTDGFVTNWVSTGTSFDGATGLQLIVGNDYQIAGAGDFNGDGLDDILWQRSDGFITDWLSTGTSFNGAAGASVTPGAGWTVADVGDFNGDGMEDLLLRHTDGRVNTWQSTGSGFQQNTSFLLTVATAWQIEGVTDVNGDGRDDIVWRHSDGTLTQWLASGSSFNGAGQPVYTVPTDWNVLL